MNRKYALTAAILGLAITELSACGTGTAQPTAVVTVHDTQTVAAPPAAEVTTTAPAPGTVLPNVVHYMLDSAENMLGAAGLDDSQVVETTLGENSFVLIASNWVVLTETPKPGSVIKPGQLVHLGVVKLSDPMAAGIAPAG